MVKSKVKKRKANSPNPASQTHVSDTPPRRTACGSCKLDMIDEIDYDPLKCSICRMNFHDECLHFDPDTADALRRIVDIVGWSCHTCIERARDSAKESTSFNPAIIKLREEFDELRGYCSDMHKDIRSIKDCLPLISTISSSGSGDKPVADDQHAPQQRGYSAAVSGLKLSVAPRVLIPEGAKAVEPLNKTTVLRAICSENKDSARRKFNVIVTGLEPDRRDNDVTIFSKLCYDHLSSTLTPISTRLSHVDWVVQPMARFKNYSS